ELNGVTPNYFGEQRFGSVRKNTHLVGREILVGNFKGAVLNYLTFTNNEENEDAVIARKELASDLDYSKALKDFPRHLKYEKIILNHLAKNPNDFVNSLRKLPRGLLLMFVHAYQSYIFNVLLSKRISTGNLKPEEGEYTCALNDYGFPDLEKKTKKGFLVGKLIGYESSLNEVEKELFEKEAIDKEMFKIKSLPEISSKGSFRTLLTPLKDFNYKVDEELILSFSLQAGSYATVVLREFIDLKTSS
ncbi:tRNA pseudouridine(13) synthase TruD, partial [Candidatus Micrarchaeota archaeon]|nr:tRNA pseudouridine(13) synthase TruD [Candidatus Micrarchaeota archaeon]